MPELKPHHCAVLKPHECLNEDREPVVSVSNSSLLVTFTAFVLAAPFSYTHYLQTAIEIRLPATNEEILGVANWWSGINSTREHGPDLGSYVLSGDGKRGAVYDWSVIICGLLARIGVFVPN